jgi:hypothetical protein
VLLEAALESVELVEVAAVLSCAAAAEAAVASLVEPTLFELVWLVTGVDWVASAAAPVAALLVVWAASEAAEPTAVPAS